MIYGQILYTRCCVRMQWRVDFYVCISVFHSAYSDPNLKSPFQSRENSSYEELWKVKISIWTKMHHMKRAVYIWVTVSANIFCILPNTEECPTI